MLLSINVARFGPSNEELYDSKTSLFLYAKHNSSTTPSRRCALARVQARSSRQTERVSLANQRPRCDESLPTLWDVRIVRKSVQF
jgi:hypothetical protein